MVAAVASAAAMSGNGSGDVSGESGGMGGMGGGAFSKLSASANPPCRSSRLRLSLPAAHAFEPAGHGGQTQPVRAPRCARPIATLWPEKPIFVSLVYTQLSHQRLYC